MYLQKYSKRLIISICKCHGAKTTFLDKSSSQQPQQIINNSLFVFLNEFPQKQSKEKYVDNFPAHESHFHSIISIQVDCLVKCWSILPIYKGQTFHKKEEIQKKPDKKKNMEEIYLAHTLPVFHCVRKLNEGVYDDVFIRNYRSTPLGSHGCQVPTEQFISQKCQCMQPKWILPLLSFHDRSESGCRRNGQRS